TYSFSYAAGEPESPKKRTTLGKYVTAAEAYDMWRSKPQQVKILDVRTPEEYVFVGHPPMARNIPFKIWKGQWNSEKKAFDLGENPDFVAQVKKYYSPTDTILIMCRSGDRASEAVNALAKAGFSNAYNMVDSFEGDLVTDDQSYFQGKRMRNGWKNSGAPWTYDLDADLVYRPDETHIK
ncbi:MAG: rhodanese-like domain-containing protein, partial [Desulfomonilaceae bacterium]